MTRAAIKEKLKKNFYSNMISGSITKLSLLLHLFGVMLSLGLCFLIYLQHNNSFKNTQEITEILKIEKAQNINLRNSVEGENQINARETEMLQKIYVLQGKIDAIAQMYNSDVHLKRKNDNSPVLKP